jgi:hypothetical protein
MVRAGLTFRQERYSATSVRMSDSSGETVVDATTERRRDGAAARRSGGAAGQGDGGPPGRRPAAVCRVRGF